MGRHGSDSGAKGQCDDVRCDMEPGPPIEVGVQWGCVGCPRATEMLESVNDGEDGAEGWGVGATQANELTAHAIFLCVNSRATKVVA